MIIANFLLGSTAGGIIALSYITATEYFDEFMKQSCIVFMNVSWSFSSIALILIYEFYQSGTIT